MSWLKRPLRELVTAHYGKALKKENRDENGDNQVFGSAGFVGNHNESLVHSQTIIVGRKGSVGKVIWAPDGGWVIDTAYYLTLNESKQLDWRYLYYALSVARLEKKTITTSIPGLNRDDFYDTEIPLPPLAEQKRIAAILDKADAIRQKRKQAIELADEFLRSVFLDMFGDPVTNPKGWEVRTLGDLAANKGDMVDGPFGSSVNTKVDYVENGEIPVIRTKNVSDKGTFKDDDLKFMTREKYETVIRSQVLPGDIVLTKVGTIGNVCIFPSGYPEAVLSTTGSCRIRLSSDLVTKTYIFFYLQLYKKKMLEIASAGVQPFLNMKHIKSFEVPIPSIESMERFGSLVNKVRGLTYNQKLSDPDKLFEGLSQKAFSGQL
ncbi:TPA: restriction endonuclease subunit S [Vibrio parahaemolyticus]|nr:restriction endonuclease subunit S [Vibrio parahaemolyticus]